MKTITDLKDFCPKTTIVIDGCADFKDYPEITDLGNLQEIKGYADFENSQVQDLGNLQTIWGAAVFGNRTDLQAEWEAKNKKNQTKNKMKTITNLKDFCPKTTIVIDGDANFAAYPEITDLGNLQEIRGFADFRNSQVKSLGNLQTIRKNAYFRDSKVQDLGNLQTIGRSAEFQNSQIQHLGNLQTIWGAAVFGNRTDLQAEWEAKNKKNQTKNKMKTITNLKDFCPKTTIVIDGDANFAAYPEITDLGNLQEIRGFADFRNSQVKSLGNLQTIRKNAYFRDSKVQDLGNLQTIGGWAYFENSQVQDLGNLQTIGGWAYFSHSQVQDLGNLQTIGGKAYFGFRSDLKAEWEAKQNNK